MGGVAFGPDGLLTPRMPPSVYNYVLQQLAEILGPHFHSTHHTLEAPEKSDYGDIDMLAVSFVSHRPTMKQIAELVQAEKYFSDDPCDEAMHFAIPWPENITEKNQKKDSRVIESENGRSGDEVLNIVSQNQDPDVKRYVQIDISICYSEEDLRWRLFVQGHGDLVNLVCSIVIPKGLKTTYHALYLCIPSPGAAPKKLTRVEVSRDPDKVMRFLGLDPDQFWEPFASREALMKYVTTCRFYDPVLLKAEAEAKHRKAEAGLLNSRDKHGHYSRPLFRHWFNEYIPAHADDTPGPSAHLSIDDVKEEVFSFFGGDIKQRYDAQEREIRVSFERDKLWIDIRAQLASANPEMTQSEIHDALRALRREIVPPAPLNPNTKLTDVQKAYLDCEWATVRDWAAENGTSALDRWQELVRQSRMPMRTGGPKPNSYSTSEPETYSAEDDKVILRMKVEEEASWSDILIAIGKTSKSQLQAHWKMNLQKLQRLEQG